MSDGAVSISLEFTPNPNTLKFVVNRTFMERGAANFTAAADTEKSPLAKRLFEIPGVAAVMIGTNFVTITKAAEGDWDVLAEQVPESIDGHFKSGAPALTEEWKPAASTGNETDVEKKIKEILDNEIRPAVAMDGGDIVFGRYDDGVVYLQLQGACSSCPSSIATLKMGVEARLKEIIPEIKEVVQV